ncbi:glycoside hydrolase family 3 C-terminal domain-containing protein [Aerococcaceae bacterium zg-ZUI334]|uniref:glycoside hydrolase family 3 C-terminal domain-containing protein n=1 Tax=Aerococcaceae bacterium zg-252 TaxID=2796928 RepID=UPI001B9D0F31|nr:glycoside hydrolase family 3 C-terminal domain-containing protein [Aerococcaceae bacterium zg-ZUI334]
MENKIKSLIEELTLEEKASLCSGKDFWRTKAIERLGIPSIMLADGPHGLRKQAGVGDHLGINDSIQAVCFPAGCAIASSFSRDAAKRLGETLGNECQAENVGVILGPAINIKRSPLCGRNFEYLSEDPLVSSGLSTAYINGVQSKNIGTSPKHFLANNQEFHRMTSDSIIDERTLREIYLASFEGAIKEAKPWTIMNSYNKLNGTYLCEHKEMLTDILRNEWGFDGFVVTDWGAMNERVRALVAGCELEMPGGNLDNDKEIVAAVQSGELDEDVLNQAIERLLNIIYKFVDNRDESAVFDLDADHEIARSLAEESIVLLKNDEGILPIKENQTVAYIGQYAKIPRYQGGGSSHINSHKVESALSVAGENVTFAQGFDDSTEEINHDLQSEAVRVARESDVAVLFVGLPDNFESEGYDRKHLKMPANQISLIEAVVAVQKNVVVVLHNGSAIEMPWIEKVKGVLEVYLGGQAVGGATANILYGKVNPSGRLAESFPLRLEDTPAYLTFGGEKDKSEYTEGVFVGYRYYSSKNQAVLFPFGYGLSYTSFAYNNAQVNKKVLTDKDTLTISVDVTNIGEVVGKEVIQLYVSPKNSQLIRPIRELKAFDKIELQPNETRTVKFELDKRAFAYWDTAMHDWFVEELDYELSFGRSAEEMIASVMVRVLPTKTFPKVYDLNSTMGEIMTDPKGKAIMEQVMGGVMSDSEVQDMNKTDDVVNEEMMAAMMEGMPLRQLLSFIPGLKKEMLIQLIATLNS